jgi:CDP-paratose 2-epimerase
MRILVTGGSGFVGSSLCLELKKKYPSYRVTAFDNLRRRGSELNLQEFRQTGVEFIHGDIRNEDDLAGLEGFDVMVEASAEPSVLAGLYSSPSFVIENNLYGSINCFNTCLKHRARLVFLSTSRVYPIDRIENAAYVEEDTRFSFKEQQKEAGISSKGISEELNLQGARSFYGTTKLSSELFLQEYSAFYGLDTAITRFGVIAGPRQMGRTDQGVVTLWMARHYWKRPLKYIGYGGLGKQVRDILHIDDAVDLVDLQIHDSGLFNGRVFNAGGGLETSASLREMTDICREITGNEVPVASETTNRPADLRAYISDTTKLAAETGWTPKRDVKRILTDIFEWIHANERPLRPILDT